MKTLNDIVKETWESSLGISFQFENEPNISYKSAYRESSGIITAFCNNTGCRHFLDSRTDGKKAVLVKNEEGKYV